MRDHLAGRSGVVQMLPLYERHAGHHLLEFFLGHVRAGRAQSLGDIASNGFEIHEWLLHLRRLLSWSVG
jgi:hypothetical protein